MNAPLPIGDRLRHENNVTLGMAIANCHPQDAAQIMFAALAAMETGGPRPDAFGLVKEDAAFWAETSPIHELHAYTIAGLRALGSRALGKTARASMMVAVWNTLKDDEKERFLTIARKG